jgi:hypothetical protein
MMHVYVKLEADDIELGHFLHNKHTHTYFLETVSSYMK